jgi:5'(3')-deoxyribonucleotidase
MTKKIVIACDIDEVLFPYVSGYIKYYNRIHGTDYKVSDFHSYDFSKVHGGTREYIADVVYAFHDEPEFEEIEPITGSLEAIHKLQELGELHFVTARQAAIENKTHNWIKKHFGIEKHRIHVGNHWTRTSDPVSHKRTKAEMCHAIRAEILIDDAPAYALECAAAGVKVFLFDLNGGYGWNKPTPLHENITRVCSWDECIRGIQEYIELNHSRKTSLNSILESRLSEIAASENIDQN